MDRRPTGGGRGNAPPLEQELYARHERIYPREVHGVFANLRLLGVLVLLGLYYGLPWLRWEGRQAVLLDLPARQFHIFGTTFWPQDFFYLAVLLIIAGLSLFFFTALAGRLWCGYACPQTVWTEVFLWIERKIEGDRPKQIKLDQAPWTPRKIFIKGSKHTIWILFSLYTGFTLVGYFTPITELINQTASLGLGPWQTFWILFYGFATYGNAGWMREQVCIYMCPYARFQSAMFDNDTLIISYDKQRGEPKGSRKRRADHRALGLGDCIDCGLCVQVCPTGIDIRDGLQYECIGCAGCIDVCNQIMEKMDYPKGLIRYTTEKAMQEGKAHILRPRIFIYATLLLAMSIGLFYSISQRVPLELDVIRDRNALYRETHEGLVENIYTLKVINKDTVEHSYRLAVSGLDGVELINKME
ncbi:MAG: cytochrome c oxidase accessory protein CcoG, partial [Pseudomonadota bacterium]